MARPGVNLPDSPAQTATRQGSGGFWLRGKRTTSLARNNVSSRGFFQCCSLKDLCQTRRWC
ncbi:hypothetical protein HHJ49_00005 [Escherichia coli]|nr:hypothetical protein HHJ49_00005 [Escherichia coli]